MSYLMNCRPMMMMMKTPTTRDSCYQSLDCLVHRAGILLNVVLAICFREKTIENCWQGCTWVAGQVARWLQYIGVSIRLYSPLPWIVLGIDTSPAHHELHAECWHSNSFWQMSCPFNNNIERPRVTISSLWGPCQWLWTLFTARN